MAAPDLSNITENDKTLYDSVINKLRIGGDIGANETRFIGPDAEKVLVYRDENGDIIRKLEPEGQEEPIVVGSIEGAASTLGKLEEKDKDLDTDILETKKIFVNANSIEPNNKAIYAHNVDDFIIYNNNTTPVFAKVTKRINIDDTITNTGSNTNVQNETMTDEIKAMKESFLAGVEAVYQACYETGLIKTPWGSSAPEDRTPTAIANAIKNNLNNTNATSNHLLKNYSAYSETGGKITGAIESKSAVNKKIKPGYTEYIPAGYYSAQSTVSVDTSVGTAPTAAQMKQGTSAWANSKLITGTTPERGAYTDSVSNAVDGSGKLYVRIPQGLYINNGGSGYPEINVPANNTSYNKGVTDADNRANPSSANWQAGRAQGRADWTGHTLTIRGERGWDDDTTKIVLMYDQDTELMRFDTYQRIEIRTESVSINTRYSGIFR